MTGQILSTPSPSQLAQQLEQVLEAVTEDSYDPALIDDYLDRLDHYAPFSRESNPQAAWRDLQQRLTAAAPPGRARRGPWLRRLGGLAAAVLVAASLFTVAFAASEDFRITAMNWLIEIFPGHADVTFPSNAAPPELPALQPGWLPEGYLLMGTLEESWFREYTYRPPWSESDYILIDVSLTSSLSLSVSTEEAQVSTIQVNGLRVTSIRSDYWQLCWTNEDGSLLFSVLAEEGGAEQDLVRIIEELTY